MALSSIRTPLSVRVGAANSERLSIAAWAASTAYVVGQIVQSTTSSGAFYQCTGAGTSGSSAPTWTTSYAAVTDNSVTWAYIGAGNSGDLVQRPSGLIAYISGLQNLGNMLIATFEYEGVLQLPKASATVFADGAGVYFNLATGLAVTTPPTYGFYVGDARGNAASGTTVVNVVLNVPTQAAGFGLAAYANVSASQTSGQSNATLLAAKLNIIGTSASGGYVKLPTPQAGESITVCNATGQTIQLYGNASETINGTAGATGISLTTGKSITLASDGTNWIGQAAS